LVIQDSCKVATVNYINTGGAIIADDVIANASGCVIELNTDVEAVDRILVGWVASTDFVLVGVARYVGVAYAGAGVTSRCSDRVTKGFNSTAAIYLYTECVAKEANQTVLQDGEVRAVVGTDTAFSSIAHIVVFDSIGAAYVRQLDTSVRGVGHIVKADGHVRATFRGDRAITAQTAVSQGVVNN